MAFGQLPPWLDVSPQHFMSALEAGGRIGVALSDQRQRAAEAQANRRAQAEATQAEVAMKQMALEQAQNQFQQGMGLDVARMKQGQNQFQSGLTLDALKQQQQADQFAKSLGLDEQQLENLKKYQDSQLSESSLDRVLRGKQLGQTLDIAQEGQSIDAGRLMGAYLNILSLTQKGSPEAVAATNAINSLVDKYPDLGLKMPTELKPSSGIGTGFLGRLLGGSSPGTVPAQPGQNRNATLDELKLYLDALGKATVISQ